MWDTISAGQRWYGTFVSKHKDGHLYHEEASIFPVKNEAGKIINYATVKRDITERLRAEASLRESEARQRAMIANIADVIAIIDQDGFNRYKSPNIERWFGWRPEEVVGQITWDNLHPDDLAQTQIIFTGLLSNPQATITAECRYRCKDGRYKWIEFTAANLLHDPAIEGILLNYHDISERKQAEAEQGKIQAQLSQAQKMESVGRLAGGVAHDFNNMLTIIFGYTELALNQVAPNQPILPVYRKSGKPPNAPPT